MDPCVASTPSSSALVDAMRDWPSLPEPSVMTWTAGCADSNHPKTRSSCPGWPTMRTERKVVGILTRSAFIIERYLPKPEPLAGVPAGGVGQPLVNGGEGGGEIKGRRLRFQSAPPAGGDVAIAAMP